MKGFSYALLDSVVTRGLYAFLTLVVAATGTAEALTLYVVAFIYLSLGQALTVGLIRNLPNRFLQSMHSVSHVKKIVRSVSILGFLTLPVLLLTVTQLQSIDPAYLIQLSPIFFAPLTQNIAALKLRHLEVAGKWKSVFRIRLVTGLVLLVSLVPPLQLTGNIFCAALFVPLFDIVTATMTARLARSSQFTTTFPGSEPFRVRALAGQQIRFRIISWIKVQAERALVPFLAAAPVSGLFLLATSLARVGPESIVSGMSNHLVSSQSAVDVNKGATNSYHVRAQAFNLVIFMLALASGPIWAEVLPNWPELDKALLLACFSSFPTIFVQLAWAYGNIFEPPGTKSKLQLSSVIVGIVFVVLAKENVMLLLALLLLKDLILAFVVTWQSRKYFTQVAIFAWLGGLSVAVLAGLPFLTLI